MNIITRKDEIKIFILRQYIWHTTWPSQKYIQHLRQTNLERVADVGGA